MTTTGFLIGVILLVAAGALLVYATVGTHSDASVGKFDRRARRQDHSSFLPLGDRSRVAPGGGPKQPPEDDAAPSPGRRASRAERFVQRDPAPPEMVGVTRRHFFNQGILAAQVFALTSFGSAVIAFLWPSLSGGFGSKVNAGPVDEIVGSLQEKRDPFYVPEARAYLNPYPAAALPSAKEVYSESIVTGMALGLVALFQKCPHLGCRVPWCQTSQWFECPCHGSKYNRVGEKKGGPAPRGMDRFPVDVVGGTVVVNTGIVVLGPPIGTDTTGQEAEGPNCV